MLEGSHLNGAIYDCELGLLVGGVLAPSACALCQLHAQGRLQSRLLPLHVCLAALLLLQIRRVFLPAVTRKL